MSDVHVTVLSWATAPAESSSGAVEWLVGLASVRAGFAKRSSEQEVHAIIDVLDSELKLLGKSEAWISFFGDSSETLHGCIKNATTIGHLTARLQTWVNATRDEDPTPTKLTDVYITHSNGQVYKADVFASYLQDSGVYLSETATLGVKILFASIRRPKMPRPPLLPAEDA